MPGFNQDLLSSATGATSLGGTTTSSVSSTGQTVLRDYQHAAKIFGANTYASAPKLKFLFHTYFNINASVGVDTTFLGVIVKEIKLPAFSFSTTQMNQYNRKRIIQTKIKYDPIEITFHDDNANLSTKVWETYYKYYYNDATKPGPILNAPGPGGTSATTNATGYNNRNIYDASVNNDMDWGFLAGNAGAADSTGKKVPFFKNITIFGFNNHNFTAYTLINPIITNFSHDSYNYSEGGGTMSNRMTIDYETVVYNYGAMDGTNPGNVVKGFGDASHYDTTTSPNIGAPGANGYAQGQNGLVPANGGYVQTPTDTGPSSAAVAQNASYASANQPTQSNNSAAIAGTVDPLAASSAGGAPVTTRNAPFSTPAAGTSGSPAGTSGSPPIGAMVAPPPITQDAIQTNSAGVPFSASGPSGTPIAPDIANSSQQTEVYAGYQYSSSSTTTSYTYSSNSNTTTYSYSSNSSSTTTVA